MTSDELRSIPECTARLGELFADPWFGQAIVTLNQEAEQEEAPTDSDALVSVRILERQRGAKQMLGKLLLLGKSLPTVSKPALPDFGTGMSQEEIVEALETSDQP